MPNLKPATLATIFSEVLANLAFMFTEEEPADPEAGDLWFETAISYEGPSRGTLRLRCSSAFTVKLAANLLGVDVEESQAENQAEDAVKEFMNILCGQFVTAVHGTVDIYNLTIPQMAPLTEMPDLGLPDSPERTTLSVDGHRLQLVYDAAV